MDFEEFSRKRATLEKGVKKVQFKFVLLPVLFGVAVVNVFGNGTLSFMLVAALVVGIFLGVPLQLYVSKKISNAARELGLKCEDCGKVFPLKGLGEIASTGKCPECKNQFINNA
ncbi:hypothetical protein ACFL2V_08930 [Pseudomonadota bacterium]